MLRILRAMPLLLLSAAVTAAEPTYPCFRVEQAPAIDGVVRDDPAWSAVRTVTGFEVLGGDYTTAKQSVAHACWNGATLYLAVVCEEPDIAQVSSTMSDGGDLWLEDSVEIFIEPARNGPVYQLIVSAGGSRTGSKAAADAEGWEAAAHRGDQHYAVELAVPLGVFHEEPGADWHIAFCRNIWTYESGGDKFTSWPGLTGAFLEPESYARLEFRESIAPPERREPLERALNADYRGHLVAQVRALAPAVREHMPTLKRAARDEDSPLQEQARETVLTWWRMQRLAEGAADAPLERLREAAARSKALRRRCYELRYRYLLEGLLQGR